MEVLDEPAAKVQGVVGAAIPLGSSRKDVLSGTWLGHPVHALLTDVVIGAWASAWILDLLGDEETRAAADRLIGAGCLAAIPTAAAGASDWAELGEGPRRIGLIHAVGNSTARALHTLSWFARRRNRRIGVALSFGGAAVALGSAYLGGHLSYVHGVGVNQAAFEGTVDSFTAAMDESKLPKDELVRANVEGVDVVLVRTGRSVHGIANRCSHRGCSLHEGTLDGTAVTCPCHGSTFDVRDGTVLRGPATSPQPAFDARIRSGTVEIRSRREDGRSA
jgi:nitrite reductase/ring-hydroxylating ferredoxin subunit/uncharacterized membrane protein